VAVDPRSPCIIGVAQQTWRPTDYAADDVPEPLAMWETVARAAAADTGAPDVLSRLDGIEIVYCQSWPYDDPVDRLATALGAAPRHRYYSGIGGTTPQVLVNGLAERMLAGELDLALVCGAEALDAKRRLKKAGAKPAWSFRHPQPPPFPFEAPFHPAEVAHEVFQAWLTFALWDVARRAHVGVAPAAYREQIGELFAPMTRVAAANPNAWFPVARSAHELVDATPDNRMVGYPYTKYVISVMDVDMAAALVLCTHERADALGVPAERRVYLRGWSYATDPVYVAEHKPMWKSPAMDTVFSQAFMSAGIGVDDVAHIDLYSCFPSSVHFALDALGVRAGDDRGVTVTGGLPYFGGAASDYMTHSIATMVDVLRGDPDSFGLVTGVGMHMTKHVAGVYSTTPSGAALAPSARNAPPEPPIAIVESHDGDATIATYSVVHGRDGAPDWGLLVCDVAPGQRCYARTSDRGLLDSLEAEEWVGRPVTLRNTGTMNEAFAG
jgi:acetyl-CoA C-acetyltransferase